MARVLGESEILPTTSRRRAALLRRDAPPPERLTAQDVASLKADPSTANRARIARKFGAQFDAMRGGGSGELVMALLQLLASDVETEVRRALAQAVASSDQLPAGLLGHLARDRIEVAAPLLEYSPLLKDEELIEIIRTNVMQYALAVAGRKQLSEFLSDALTETGQRPVVNRLAGNLGAKLSRQTLERIMADWRADGEIQTRLVRRPALPFEVVESMAAVIGQRIEWELVHQRRMDPLEARRLMQAVRERTAMGITAREHGDRKLERHLRERFQAGGLDHDAILRHLREGDIASFELALALHAGLDARAVRRLAYHADRRHLAALCLKADLPAPHYLTIRMALELANRSIEPTGGEDDSFSGETLRYLHGQYEELRQDSARLESLLAAGG